SDANGTVLSHATPSIPIDALIIATGLSLNGLSLYGLDASQKVSRVISVQKNCRIMLYFKV
ncbi:MAG: hypothetical protein WA364_23270, partial [Candidatus Nitrosopolaris sp.]